MYFVPVHGTDCDGVKVGKFYEFDSLEEAKEFQDSFNSDSDGLIADDPIKGQESFDEIDEY
jgi:hypothetical protein